MAVHETPLMKQYNEIKRKYPDTLLLFRVGDFYETFGEDAIRASRILNITLTKRSNGAASHVELAGFPYHALDNYMPKLVKAGARVAVCDQLEDPKQVKGIVKRGVTELVTPGVVMNDSVLDARQNNFLASLHFGKVSTGLAFLDISTGEFMVAEGADDYVQKLLQGFKPAEIIYNKQEAKAFNRLVPQPEATFGVEEWVYDVDYATEKLNNHFKTTTLKGFGIADMTMGIVAAGVVLHYLENAEHKKLSHISSLARLDESEYVWLDTFTIRNLELLHAQHQGGVPLVSILDNTQTPMGSRLLRRWIALPLKSETKIKYRLDVVQAFYNDPDFAETAAENLYQVGDLERMVSRIATRRITPREMWQFLRALRAIAPVKLMLEESNNQALNKMALKIDLCAYLKNTIEQQLKEEPPVSATNGNIMADGFNAELDELRTILHSGKDYLRQILARETEATGISSLKIAFNKVFGYYLEVTHAHKNKVPNSWIRKQTLTNAERYITPELKEYEDKILNAEERINNLEFDLFNQLVETAAEFIVPVQQNARTVSSLDCLVSFARTALTNHYVRPNVNNSTQLEIKEGRHPVVEQQMPPGQVYIPNDIVLDSEQDQILIITGPNMSGKSALLRQVALICLMAQAGSFVPAGVANLGVVDKVFTRVGASDNLSRGESTFMVEMTETASILNNLSARSLVLMDEIGRGTSTYDGISIAWSIVEYLHNQTTNRPKTLFATHYHELNALADELPRVKNFNVAVKQSNGQMVFLRKLQAGGSEHSFGIQVAQMAGIPNQVVLRAAEILKFYETERNKNKSTNSKKPPKNYQLNIFETTSPELIQLRQILQDIDINQLPPLQALLKLNELKQLIKPKEEDR